MAYLNMAINLHNPYYRLYNLILFVTSKCNGKCKGCLYSKKLNKAEDLSLDEIEKISQKIGNIRHLMISGGEPFLRDDLPRICKYFIKNNKTKLITIPTNGLMPDKISAQTSKLLKNKDCHFGIGVSIDGTREKNYHHRGSKFAFSNAIQTYAKLQELCNMNKNLSTRFSSRITKENSEDLIKLNKFLKKKFPGCYHSATPIRGKIQDNVHKPEPEQYLKTIKAIKGKNLFTNSRQNFMANILRGNKWPFPCVAGEKIAVIDSDGHVRLCELLEPVGDIRKFDYDYNVVIKNSKSRKQMEEIKTGDCSKGCTHGCFLEPSAFNNPLNLFKILNS